MGAPVRRVGRSDIPRFRAGGLHLHGMSFRPQVGKPPGTPAWVYCSTALLLYYCTPKFVCLVISSTGILWTPCYRGTLHLFLGCVVRAYQPRSRRNVCCCSRKPRPSVSLNPPSLATYVRTSVRTYVSRVHKKKSDSETSPYPPFLVFVVCSAVMQHHRQQVIVHLELARQGFLKCFACGQR